MKEIRRDFSMADFETIAILGEGAFGLVKLVRLKATGETFALKCMQKARIVSNNQQKNVVTEKNLLAEVRHPFVLRLEGTFRDMDSVYMVLEFLQGGDVFGQLMRVGGVFDIDTTRYYAASVLSVLKVLHAQKIVYRDLKPENLVLDADGICKVVDFGFAKRVQTRTYTHCGTPEYVAPEIIKGKGHGKGVDYWALGILIFEFLCGYSPFADPDNNQLKIYKNVMRGRLAFPKSMRDLDAQDLVQRLLTASPNQRLGCLKEGADGIINHVWFASTDFEQLLAGNLAPPIVPVIDDALDVSNFDLVDPRHDVVQRFTGNDDDWSINF